MNPGPDEWRPLLSFVEPIAKMVGNYEWSSIEEEIAKCEVRCANCHRQRTALQFGWPKLELHCSKTERK